MKVIRSCFGDALKQGLLTANAAKQVPTISNRDRGGSVRRGFTIAEVKRLLTKADTEWRGMILFGLYTAQRLGDLASITWRSIDLEDGELALTAGKTGRRVILPLVKPLKDYLATVDVTDNPDAFIFSRQGEELQGREFIRPIP